MAEDFVRNVSVTSALSGVLSTFFVTICNCQRQVLTEIACPLYSLSQIHGECIPCSMHEGYLPRHTNILIILLSN